MMTMISLEDAEKMLSGKAFTCHTHDDFGKGRERGLLDARAALRSLPAVTDFQHCGLCGCRVVGTEPHLPQAEKPLPTLVCEKCGADRYKEPCKGDWRTCPMAGAAAAPKGEA